MEIQRPNRDPSAAPRWREPIPLQEQERRELHRIAGSSRGEHRLVERARIILAGADGAKSLHQIGRELSVARSTVRKWLTRYRQRRAQHPERPVASWLADEERVGTPARFDELLWIDVLALVTSDPKASGRPISHWTVRELTDEIIERELVKRIHFTTVSRFLASCQLRPDRVQEWMNRKPQPDFDTKAAQIKDELVQATSEEQDAQSVTVSFDEKTGMQAKERLFPDQPLSPGRPTRREFEYKRHGTLVLLAAMVVHSGEIVPAIRDSRTNEVTAQVLVELFTRLMEQGYKRIRVILDQLNTHWSQVLVQSVARLCNLPIPEDSEIETGAQRRAWLTEPDKPIVLLFTPKHASWLNPIELWFKVLSQKVLRRGSFRSTTDLEQQVRRFVDYYNQRFAHAYTFKQWRSKAA